MRQLVLPLLFCAAVSCAGKNDNKSATVPASDAPAHDTSRYAIIPFMEKDVWLFRNAKPASLSAEEIKDIEVLLAETVATYNKGAKDSVMKIKPLERYKRQLVAVLNQKGEKEVWVNCFCGGGGSFFDKWQQQIISIDGGGSCFFDVKINLATKKTYDLMVNGPI